MTGASINCSTGKTPFFVHWITVLPPSVDRRFDGKVPASDTYSGVESLFSATGDALNEVLLIPACSCRDRASASSAKRARQRRDCCSADVAKNWMTHSNENDGPEFALPSFMSRPGKHILRLRACAASWSGARSALAPKRHALCRAHHDQIPAPTGRARTI